MPLTLEGVREVQANPPQPPRGSGFSGPWAKAMAEAQAQTQVKRTASHVMGGTSEGGEDVKVIRSFVFATMCQAPWNQHAHV